MLFGCSVSVLCTETTFTVSPGAYNRFVRVIKSLENTR